LAKINSMMDVGKRAMMNSQTALQTVGHNIANKSTEGFSRQRIETQTNIPISEGRYQVGMGAKTSSVTRINDIFLEKQLRFEGTQLGFEQAKSDAMTRVEQIYNEQMNKGLNQSIGEFFNSFRELATNPESTATRTLVRDTAKFVTKDFAKAVASLRAIQGELDQQVTQQVGQINAFGKEIAQLNEKIAAIEISGAPANDQRDRRDLLIKKMSEMANVRVTEAGNGMISVTVGNSGIIVSGNSSNEITSGRVENKNGREGIRNAIFIQPAVGADPMNITKEIKNGSLGGIFEVRDVAINSLLDDVDELAFSFINGVNGIHRQGFDAFSNPGGALFAPLQNKIEAAQNMGLDAAVAKDPGRIVAGIMPNAPGDNRIANMIGELQQQRVMEQGTTTYDEFYNSIVGKVGIATEKANRSAESQKNIHAQLENIRDSVSGVSLDEEATKMIEFQKTFDASAKLIQTADEMFDTILAMKR